MNKITGRLGMQVILIVVVLPAASLLAINVITVNTLRSYADTVLVDRASVGMQVLEDSIDDETGKLEASHRALTEDRSFMRAVRDKDIKQLTKHFETEFGTDSEDYFMAVGETNGSLVYKTDSYLFDEVDMRYGRFCIRTEFRSRRTRREAGTGQTV